MFLFISYLQTDPMFNNNNNNNNNNNYNNDKNNYSEIHDEDSLQISILTNLNVSSFDLKICLQSHTSIKTCCFLHIINNECPTY